MNRYLEGRNSSIFYIARWNDKGKPRQPWRSIQALL
jgi:hypothetical protein